MRIVDKSAAYQVINTAEYLRILFSRLTRLHGRTDHLIFTNMPKVVGIPIKLIHEAEGHVITVETTMGEVYRGQMIEAEDSMNLALANVTMTAADGRQSRLEHVYLRGSKIRFVILPDMLRNAPMFKRLADSKNRRTQGPGIGKKQH